MLAARPQRASAVNVSTVYRTLEVLEELGLVRHAHLSDRAPTYHSVGGHEHFHLVCRNCHRVISVDADVADRSCPGCARSRLHPRPRSPDRVRPVPGVSRSDLSPLLDLPGAVAGDGIDAPVAAHYGSLYGEQRTLAAGEGFVDLSHRDVRPDQRARTG